MEPRPFYSPEIGDDETAFETKLSSVNIQTEFPKTHELKTYLLAALDDRHAIFQRRRFSEILNVPRIVIPDNYTRVKKIKSGYLTIDWKPNPSKKSIQSIHSDLEFLVTLKIKEAIEEQRYNSKIEKDLINQVISIVDYIDMEPIYKIQAAVVLVTAAVNAV